jgi:hypothetical protein
VGWCGDGGDECAGDGDDGDGDDDSDEVWCNAMTMAMISPLWEGIFPVDSCLPESFSFSGVFRPAEAVVSISDPPFT